MISEESNTLSVSRSDVLWFYWLSGCVSPQGGSSHPGSHHPCARTHRCGHERLSESDGAHPADPAAEVLPAALAARRADHRPAGLHGHYRQRKDFIYTHNYSRSLREAAFILSWFFLCLSCALHHPQCCTSASWLVSNELRGVHF